MWTHKQEPERTLLLILSLLSASQPIYTTFGLTWEHADLLPAIRLPSLNQGPLIQINISRTHLSILPHEHSASRKGAIDHERRKTL